MHDPFDPRFGASVRNSLRRVVPQVKGDAWCLGYFVDNELSWGGFGDEIGFLTVTDTPYPELVASARAIHRQAYARRAGKP